MSSKKLPLLIMFTFFLTLMIPLTSLLSWQGLHFFAISNATATPARSCLDVVSGGPPKDGIPAIDHPQFVSHDEFVSSFTEGYLETLEVIGVVVDGEARAYPIDIMNWHEIVNDKIKENHFSITYCPLTGSGIFYSTDSINGSTLGTTGKLYENNLVFYDRQTDTWWGQMLNLALCGPLAGSSLEMLPVVHVSWKIWETMYPDTVVLSRNTGYDRDYDVNPYAGYDTSGSIWFYTTYTRDLYPYGLFHPKEVTHVAIRNFQPFLFPQAEIEKVSVVNIPDPNNLEPLATVHDRTVGFTQSFKARLATGEELLFQSYEDSEDLPSSETFGLTVFQDVETGSLWNMKGKAIDGPLKGTTLERYPSYDVYWFSAVVHFPNALILVNNSFIENIGGSLENINFTAVNQQKLDNDSFLIDSIGFIVIVGALSPLILVMVRDRRSRPRS